MVGHTMSFIANIDMLLVLMPFHAVHLKTFHAVASKKHAHCVCVCYLEYDFNADEMREI